jgi:hypothetical protein
MYGCRNSALVAWSDRFNLQSDSDFLSLFLLLMFTMQRQSIVFQLNFIQIKIKGIALKLFRIKIGYSTRLPGLPMGQWAEIGLLN